MSWTLLADGVVAILLIATLVYVRRFSKHIAAIRDSRGEFEKLIADLTKSTDQAASHLHLAIAYARYERRDLQARVERGEFASLDEGVAAELAELNYRRAAEIVGGSDKLEALLDQLEAEDDPSADVDAFEFLGGLRAKYARLPEGHGEPPGGVSEDVESIRLSIEKSIAEDDYEDAEIVSRRLRQRYGEAED